MRRLFSNVSSIALLLCLTTQTVFSMSEESEGNSARGAAAASSSTQGILAGASRSSEEEWITILVGTQKLKVSIPEDKVVCHYRFQSLGPNYKKLRDKILPQLLKVESLKGKIPKDQFLRLCNGYLEKVVYPLKIYIEDARTLWVMMSCGETSLESAAPTPKKDGSPEETTSDGARAPVQHPPVSLNIAIENHLEISKKVSNIRGRLLELKREALDGTEEEGCLKEEIDSYKKFLAYISQFETQIQSQLARNIFLECQYEAHHNISNLIEKLGRFYLSKEQKDAYIGSVAAKIESLSHHLNVTRELLKIDPLAPNLIETQKELIDDLFSLSVVEYGSYLTRDPQRALGSYDRAMAYNRQLKESGATDLYKKNRGTLENLKPKKTSLLLRSGPRLEGVLSALQTFEVEKSEGSILLEHRQFSSFMRASLKNKKSLPEQSKQIQARIVCFENKMIGRESSSFLSATQLDNFYQEYKKALTGRSEELVDVTNLLVEFFMMTGRLEQSVNHIDSFKKVYGGSDQTEIFKVMDLKSAVLKALQGDPEEFLSLIEGVRQVSAERDRQRLAQKAEGERRRNEFILAAVAAAEKEKKAQTRVFSTKPQPSEHLAAKLTPAILVSSTSLFETNISGQQTRQEKEERHQQSLERKEQERREKAKREARQQQHLQQGAAAAGAGAGAAAAEDFTPEEEGGEYVPFDPKIIAGLTTLQKRLEREMETGSWNFTREELQDYYSAFGCKISQRGSHVKAALPKFEEILLPDGTLLVINFNFEGFELQGGSFPFGKWQDTVPRYLRPQILEARRRIQAFKDVVHEEIRRATADQGDDDDE